MGGNDELLKRALNGATRYLAEAAGEAERISS
jgi:hypothetical protein